MCVPCLIASLTLYTIGTEAVLNRTNDVTEFSSIHVTGQLRLYIRSVECALLQTVSPGSPSTDVNGCTAYQHSGDDNLMHITPSQLHHQLNSTVRNLPPQKGQKQNWRKDDTHLATGLSSHICPHLKDINEDCMTGTHKPGSPSLQRAAVGLDQPW